MTDDHTFLLRNHIYLNGIYRAEVVVTKAKGVLALLAAQQAYKAIFESIDVIDGGNR